MIKHKRLDWDEIRKFLIHRKFLRDPSCGDTPINSDTYDRIIGSKESNSNLKRDLSIWISGYMKAKK